MTTNIVCGVPANTPGSPQQDGIQMSLLCKGTDTWFHSADVETEVQRGQATHSHSHSIQQTNCELDCLELSLWSQLSKYLQLKHPVHRGSALAPPGVAEIHSS